MKIMLAVTVYVEQKRVNGIAFDKAKSNLLSFCKQVGDRTLEAVTTHDILTYLDGPLTSTVTWRGKHSLLRHFFEYWDARGFGALPLMPPSRPLVRQTFTPYIYTRAEIRALLKATAPCQAQKACAIDAQTLRALIIVLYGTGALVGQVIALQRKDVDFRRSLITFRSGRFNRTRSIPIGKDLWAVLRKHLGNKRAKAGPDLVFASKTGGVISPVTLIHLFRRLRVIAGVQRSDGAVYQPRMHDLRATFAVHRITSWVKNGADLNRMLPALSTYMGNMGLSASERYLLLTPERFRKELVKLSAARGRKRWRDDPALMQFLRSL